MFRQRYRHPLSIQVCGGMVDRVIECAGVEEELMDEMERLKVAPDKLDVVRFRCIFCQPFNGKPVGEGGYVCADRAVDRRTIFAKPLTTMGT